MNIRQCLRLMAPMLAGLLPRAVLTPGNPVPPAQSLAVMQRVADWQMAHFEEQTNRVYTWPNDHKRWAWTNGTLYVGLAAYATLTSQEKIWQFLKTICQQESWKPGPNLYHADDICVGQAYAELFRKYGDSSMIKPTVERARFVMNNPKSTPLDFTIPHNQDRWSWCDALFMAPTVYARLGKLTGDERLIRFMDSEFWATYDTLFNEQDHLFFRDTRYKTKQEANGKNVYWGRGNGWVIGGLTIIIDNLPDNYPTKPKYIALYKQMIRKIATLQDEKGFWHPSLLDYQAYPMPETSSSAFFTYGLVWGINRGYLDRKKYAPVAQKGWAALLSAVHADGKLGWVQEIGADPKRVSYDDTEVYGVGAFLLAGSEMVKLKTK